VAKQLLSIAVLLLISACKPINEQEKQTIPNEPAQCIKSQSECEIRTQNANFTVKFSQHKLSDTIKTELPFSIELHQSSHFTQPAKQAIIKVSAYLEGKDMFMGKVPVFFNKESDIYLAESLLASCSEERMVWRLWITVDMIDNSQTFFVDFTSQRL